MIRKNFKKAALKVRANSDVLVVVGIGGSYLGARSAIEMLKGYFRKNDVEIIFLLEIKCHQPI